MLPNKFTNSNVGKLVSERSYLLSGTEEGREHGCTWKYNAGTYWPCVFRYMLGYGGVFSWLQLAECHVVNL